MARLLFLQNIDYEFLGPMYISAYARARGHSVHMAIGQTEADLAPEIERIRPDVLGFSIMSGSHRWARDMAGALKARYGLPTLFGGAHPTFFPEFAREPAVDWLVRGEGEETVTELLDALDAGRPVDTLPNLWLRRGSDGELVQNEVRPLRADLDDYPFPDRHLYDALEGRLDRGVRNVITSRGCPWHCSFCFEDAMRELYDGKGKYVRIRKIDAVIAECQQIKALGGVRLIYFADDVFGMKKDWLYTFLPRFKREVGLPFVCLVRADIVASDPHYAEALAEGGCQSVFFGVESGNERLRNKVLNKDLSDAEIVRAAGYLHAAGVKFRSYNIMGLPEETLADALSTVELNIRIRTDYPWCSIFSPLPGTELARYAEAEGYLPPGFDAEALSRSFFLRSEMDMPDIDAIQNLQKLFQTAVLWPRTWPAVKRLIHLPPNPAFTAWFGLIYFYTYVKSEQRDVPSTLRFALKNYRHILARQ